MSSVVAVGVVSFLLALAITPLMAGLARRWDVLDRPDGQLKQHRAPVPYLGGLALAGSTLLPLLVLAALRPGARGLVAFVAAGVAIALAGLWDDLRPLPPRAKLLLQLLVAVPLLAGLGGSLPGGPLLGGALAVAWVVGLTNAFNLLDIMDGLAAGVAAAASLGFVALGLARGDPGEGTLAAAALAGGALGFLGYNVAPARIYMGDAGSQFLGLSLGAVALLDANAAPTSGGGLLAGLVVLAVPVLDMSLLIVLRTRKGIPFWRGSDDHLALRLRRRGLSVRWTALCFWGAGLLCAAAALVLGVVVRP